DSLQADFGSGLIISFRKETEFPVHHRNQGVVILEYPEQYGYETLPIPISEHENQLGEEKAEPVTEEAKDAENLENHSAQSTPGNIQKTNIDTKEVDEKNVTTDGKSEKEDEQGYSEQTDSGSNVTLREDMESYNKDEKDLIDVESKTSTQNQVRPLIGLTNQLPVHWEFNKLPNRHLVI